MSDPLACYGPHIPALADLVGAVDVESQGSWEAWYVAQWRAFADGVGFREVLDPVLESVLKSKGKLGSLTEAPINALVQWIDTLGAVGQSPADYPAEKIALLREQIIEEWRSSAKSLWRVSVEPGSMAGKGCVGSYRVFPHIHAGTYFRGALSQDPTQPAGCAWSTPLVVFLGTWPWYSGAALFDLAPGLRWRSVGQARPAEQGARVMASAWTFLGNARIDARDVVAQFDRLMSVMGPMLSEVKAEPSGLGSVYGVPGGLLRVYLGDVRGRYLNGPLGPVSLAAYNHCVRCFAAFFALRRAMMTGTLKDGIRDVLNKNPDPCVFGKFPSKKPIPKGGGKIKGA